jgi:hypothetical protein
MSSYTLVNGDRPTIPKAPTASLRYGIDVAGVLATGDTVTGCSGAVASGSITAGTPTFSGSIITVRLSGGTVGETAKYTFSWSTAAGDSDSRTIYLPITAR